MTDRIEVDYDELTRVCRNFTSEADAIAQLTSQTRSKVANLHGSGWIGQGSEAFYAEMENVLFPAMDRLQKALQDTNDRTLDVIKVFHEAEQECSSLFQSA
jgi:WXG100 family type VII secretion target